MHFFDAKHFETMTNYNFFLAEALLRLVWVIPFAAIAWKLGFPSVRWHVILIASAVLSWFVSNAYFQVWPGSMGFGAWITGLFGWAYLLPGLALALVLYAVARRWRGSMAAKWVALGLTVVFFALPIAASCRWIPKSEAREIAIKQLRNRGHTEARVIQSSRVSDGWIVYVSITGQENDYPVFLSRSGFCTGTGG